ncbi:MAG: hypothetical protein OWU33_13060 [Firmicutes bacterium]|nr:hypothetical protein [Bacillota bacterium]
MAQGQADQWNEAEAYLEPLLNAVNQGSLDQAALMVESVEDHLKPWQPLCKSLTISYVGHAHMDMNWLWDWPETVTMVLNTLQTVNRLMDEFPHFRFSQSQTAVYDIVRRFDPALFDQIGQRVRDGRWEITANQWVEGDKNLASAESIVRHVLYSKAFFHEHWGIPYDAVRVAFEPDTFGHPQALPTIYQSAGVQWLYYCRGGPGHPVFRWQAPDGAEVMAWSDYQEWYNGTVTGDEVLHAVEFFRETGIPHFLKVYGVGDHGGGPTKRDLRRLAEMESWPIFPTIKTSSLAAFFEALESYRDQMPVHVGELNYVFPGCYSAKSDVKTSNVENEALLRTAEGLESTACLLGVALPSPLETARSAWITTLFNQFHDILSGSGVPETYTYALGRAQDATATARVLASQAMAAVTRAIHLDSLSAGSVPVVVFNPLAWDRTDMVEVDVYEQFAVGTPLQLTDDEGHAVPLQYLYDRYFGFPGHSRVRIVFPADVPGLGYRVFFLSKGPNQSGSRPISGQALSYGHQALALTGTELAELGLPSQISAWRLDHLPRHFRLYFQLGLSSYQQGFQVDTAWYSLRVHPGQSGAEIVDKNTGRLLTRVGELTAFVEEPHNMSSWEVGPERESFPVAGTRWTLAEAGPVRFVLQGETLVRSSRVTARVLCYADRPEIDWQLTLDWRETGSDQVGVPGLRIRFPSAPSDVDSMVAPRARFGQSLGSIARAIPCRDVPAQGWTAVDHPDGTHYVLHPTRHGVSVDHEGIQVTLLRASYDPDPYAELGKHETTITYGWSATVLTSDACTRRAMERMSPLTGMAADPAQSSGSLPHRFHGLSVSSALGVVTAVKPAEDGRGLVVRLSQDSDQNHALPLAIATVPFKAEALTVVEQPTNHVIATTGQLVSVPVPSHGLATVRIVTETRR